MNNPTMLYRCPGRESFEGVACETTIVDETEVEAKLADGWHTNWIEAGAAHQEAADKLQANEDEQARIAAQLKEAGAAGLHMVHKGRGKYDVLDAAGAVVHDNVTKDEAQAHIDAAAAGG